MMSNKKHLESRASFMPELLIRCATKLHEDDRFPVLVPAETVTFLQKLGCQCDSAFKPLGQFMLGIQSHEFNDAILQQIDLPEEYRELQSKLEEQQIEKEMAIRERDFERAGRELNAQCMIKSQMVAVPGTPIEITPTHILQAIANLGYAKPIEV